MLDPGLWAPLLPVMHPSRNSEDFGIIEIEVLFTQSERLALASILL